MANPKEVELLGLWVSPFVRRVEWALKLKGIAYDYIEEDILNKSALLLRLNPVHQKVPVLVHAGRVVCESFLILEYIDETWKQNPLLPRDPYDRAMARFCASVAEGQLLANAWVASCSEGEEQERAIKVATEALGHIEGVIKGKAFFGGEGIGYLDLAIGWVAYWLPIWDEVGSMKIFDPAMFPATAAWTGRFIEHPVIKENLPPRDKTVVYCRQKRSQMLASKSHA
ncbi:glutathione transferase GST 23-like [Eucalyptus grandis]|uniref:glutathione transferase GST 23-like n=1 Tax=Eucalyptus grandis TaxID=71139 RepID=UPI00192E8378|nr:glutathione transferase GST 23-like [Eucalyptus grandis]